MGLTKIRAGQISNIDYKQSCRVLTDTNITLSGGAPAEVDGVSLITDDRVLVIGQTNKAQNGLYRVDILGTGSDGSWVRTGDTDTQGELEAGAIVMVTEGTVYKDTQWKLITNDPIVIGTSELIFEQNSAFAFGNISANGTAVLANTVGDAVTFVAGDNIAITGNNATKTVTFAVSGISLSSIANGASNLEIATANGNITGAVDGNNVLILTSTGANIDGYITAIGNVTGGNFETAGDIVAIGNVTADTFLGNVEGNISGDIAAFTGNITADTVLANIDGATATFTGNVTADTFVGNISGITGIFSGNVTADTVLANIDGATATFSGNVTADTVLANIDGTTATFSGNVTADTFVGNVQGNISGDTAAFTGNVTADTVIGNVDGTTATFTGNVTADTFIGNLDGATATFTGNVAADYFLGNLDGATATFTGNVTADTFIGNIQGNIDAGGANTEIQFNDDDVLAGSSGFTFDKTSNLVTISGNVSAANLISSGLVAATGNIVGGNIETAGEITAAGNITGGNLVTSGTISAATLSISGNATIGGNLTVQGNLIYVNVEDLRVVDPIIIMGTGPNGDPLTSDDGQDRGIYMEYYIADLGNAFMGFQNSSGNLIAASNVGFSANNVISVVEYGTLQAGNLYVESVISVGNISGDNILGNGAALSGIDGFGNIDANGTAILASTVGDTLVLTAGNNIAITGNAATKSVTIDVTGISLNSISNGTSNVTVVSSGGNVTVGIAGNQIANFNSTGVAITGTVSGNGTTLTGINAFGNIAVSGETTVSADNTSDTLTFAEGSGISITTDAANNIITIGSVATDSIFATGGDMGLITDAVTVSEDLGLITDAFTVEYDLGLIVTSGIIQPDSLILPTKTVAQLANLSASPAAQFVYCSDESGGAVPAFSDGTNWRRVTDRAVVT